MAESVLRFEEKRLVGDLADLAPAVRAVFAAACAERLLPVYRWFHGRTGQGDPDALERALADLWNDLEGRPSGRLDAQREVAELLVPLEDASWVDGQAYAENAAAAVAYAIRARLTGSPQEAAWAARQLADGIDHRITRRDDVDFDVPGAEERIARDDLIQSELARQRRDLDVLRASAGGPPGVVATSMRQAARADAPLVFDFQAE